MSETQRPLRATYRLQLEASFGFAQATALLPYLQKLGISHLYLSPVLEAASGSTHGYDVIDHSQLSDALGGSAGFAALATAAHQAGLGLIVDIVPNHMSISDPANRWWWDVLENGPAGRWAHAFDVDWNPPERRLKNTVLLPVLGDHRSRIIEKKELTVAREGARFMVRYHDHRFPVAPRSLGYMLQHAAARHDSTHLAFIADAFAGLPAPTQLDAASVERRHRDKEVLRELLAQLLQTDPPVGKAIDDTIAQVNSTPEMLDALLELQNYRLAFWRAAERDLDYRRFFDINSLVALKMEDPLVFDEAHALIGKLVAAGQIDGLRVDHVDGLANPEAYLRALKKLAPSATVHVEKILGADELLKPWPVEGTTGYEFGADVTNLFLPASSEQPIAALQKELTGRADDFHALATAGKQQVLKELLASDVSRLANNLIELGDRYHELRDFSRHDLREAVAALAASFPVYRTYVVPSDSDTPDVTDRAIIREAVTFARALVPGLDPSLLDFVQSLLLLERTGATEAIFVQRFQQLSAPGMAKGVEDTAFYRDTRLLALTEVGSDPARFSLSPEAFHARNQAAAKSWPNRMLATSTHDTKRSEDVRARLVAMAQQPEKFAALARAFFKLAARATVNGQPEPSMVMFALQTMVGAWPLDVERLHATMLKSVREAKQFTFWTRNNEAYEKALASFCTAVLADQAIRTELDAFVLQLTPAARTVSLGWSLLKCTCPGVPDFYQGTELWNFSLVDPDNRRPVEWPRRLEAIADTRVPSVESDEVGVTKLHVISRALQVRRELPAAFGPGSSYTPLKATGAHADNLIAFVRSGGGSSAVVAVTRIPLADWGDTTLALPSGRYRSWLRGPEVDVSGTVKLSELFSKLPVALLTNSENT